MGDFNGKVAIITGALGGMGKTVALKLASLGSDITLVDIVEEGANETIQLIEEKGGNAIFVKADTSSAPDVRNYVDETINTFGKVDLFYNNAGIVGSTANITDQSIEQIDKTIDINLKGGMYGMKYVLGEMLKTGGGSIVNTASGAGLGGTKGMSSYSASKHGVVGFTKTAALEYAEDNIKINAIAPGSVDTPMIKNIDEDTQKEIENSIPMKRLGRMEEIANIVVYLFSENSSYITGTVIPIDGGFTA